MHKIDTHTKKEKYIKEKRRRKKEKIDRRGNEKTKRDK
jgi:hypothetical protein